MEADFNATYKVMYDIQMLHNMHKYRLVPEEVYSKRNHLADDGTLSKVLFYNIVQHLWHPAGLALVNADNCYIRIAHPMAWFFNHLVSLLLQLNPFLRRFRIWNSTCRQATVTPRVMLVGLMIHLETTEKHKECAKAMAPLRQLGLLQVF